MMKLPMSPNFGGRSVPFSIGSRGYQPITVEDAVIAAELKAKSDGALVLPEGVELEGQADILRSVRKTSDALARPHKKNKKKRR